jgi:hypothetical protein
MDVACYPWCPDFWAFSTVVALTHQASATAAAAAAAHASTNKNQFAAAAVAAAAAAAACDPTCSTAESGGLGPDPMPLLAQGVQVLQPLMPFMTAFQLLRAPLMVHGAGLRLKRALLLDPFRTVVPAAAFTVPGQQQMHSMTLMDAHCGSFQQVRRGGGPFGMGGAALGEPKGCSCRQADCTCCRCGSKAEAGSAGRCERASLMHPQCTCQTIMPTHETCKDCTTL